MDSLRPGCRVKRADFGIGDAHGRYAIGAIDETFSAPLQIKFRPCGVT